MGACHAKNEQNLNKRRVFVSNMAVHTIIFKL
jgi:hypothetical protein